MHMEFNEHEHAVYLTVNAGCLQERKRSSISLVVLISSLRTLIKSYYNSMLIVLKI